MKSIVGMISLLLMVACNGKVESKKAVNYPKEVKEIRNSKGLLESKETKFDAGVVKKGQAIIHTFGFKNTGSEAVVILEKTMSCNCTNLETTSDTIQPNEITNLKVKIDTKDKSKGKHEATITVKTNGLRRFYLLETIFEIVD